MSTMKDGRLNVEELEDRIAPKRPGLGRVTGMMLVLALLATLAQAASIYVSKTGNDTTGDGTSYATAYLTITKAVTEGTEGDTILIYPGTYVEGTLDLTDAATTPAGLNKYFIFQGVGPWRSVKYWSTGAMMGICVKSGTVIRNMEIRANQQPITSRQAISFFTNHPVDGLTIDCVYAYDTMTTGATDGCYLLAGANITITNSHIISNFDALMISNVNGLDASDSIFETRGTNVAAQDMKALYGTSLTADCVFNRCKIIARSTLASQTNAVGVVGDGITLNDCLIQVSTSNTANGLAIGIDADADCTIAASGCKIITTGASPYDVYGDNIATSIVNLTNCYYDAAKLTDNTGEVNVTGAYVNKWFDGPLGLLGASTTGWW